MSCRPGQALDGRVDRIDGAVADAGVLDDLFAVAVAKRDRRGGDDVGPGDDLEAGQLPAAPRQFQLLVHQGFDVLVEDFFFLVGQRLELGERRFQLVRRSGCSPAWVTRSRKAWRPLCLPSTSALLAIPTSAESMIS